MWATHWLASKLHLNTWVIENEDVHLLEDSYGIMQKQEEEGICMHDTLTESSLNKELIVLGEMEEALIFCHDIKYIT